MKKTILIFILIFSFLYSEKIKTISEVVGVRENQIMGYGLVVGLNGTGDSEDFSMQTITNMLSNMGIKIDPSNVSANNAAVVIVTSNMPAFSMQGDKLDVTVSSIGDASSLKGGTLIMTPLKGVDGSIYAIAQGALSVGTLPGRQGGGGVHELVAKIPGGGIIEKTVTYDLLNKKTATLSLNSTGFQNAILIQDSINRFFGTQVAKAKDPKTVALKRPNDLTMVEFLALVQDIDIAYQSEENIVIDEKTGTIVAGANIFVDPVVISHGAITIEITENIPNTSAPASSSGAVNMGNGVKIDINTNIIQSSSKPTVASLARALQKLGANPGDIIAIFQTIKSSGAIRAKLKVI